MGPRATPQVRNLGAARAAPDAELWLPVMRCLARERLCCGKASAATGPMKRCRPAMTLCLACNGGPSFPKGTRRLGA
jgi:hypothetical protein